MSSSGSSDGSSYGDTEVSYSREIPSSLLQYSAHIRAHSQVLLPKIMVHKEAARAKSESVVGTTAVADATKEEEHVDKGPSIMDELKDRFELLSTKLDSLIEAAKAPPPENTSESTNMSELNDIVKRQQEEIVNLVNLLQPLKSQVESLTKERELEMEIMEDDSIDDCYREFSSTIANQSKKETVSFKKSPLDGIMLKEQILNVNKVSEHLPSNINK